MFKEFVNCFIILLNVRCLNFAGGLRNLNFEFRFDTAAKVTSELKPDNMMSVKFLP